MSWPLSCLARRPTIHGFLLRGLALIIENLILLIAFFLQHQPNWFLRPMLLIQLHRAVQLSPLQVVVQIPLVLLREAGAAEAVLLDLFVDLLLNKVDDGVDLVILEEGQFCFWRQAEKRFDYDLCLCHEIHEFYVMIPVLLPSEVTDDLI